MVNVGELVLRRREAIKFFGLRESPLPPELRTAFRKAVLQYHPDRNQQQNGEEATKTMRKIIEWYKILSTPKSEEEEHTERFYGGFII